MIFLKTLFLLNLPSLGVGEIGPSHSVSLPGNLQALGGSCVLIPCTFNISGFESKLNTSGSIYGLWLKGGYSFNNDPVVFNGTNNTTMLFERIEILGNLRLKNCTTVFYNVNQNHTDKYFFRTEMKDFRATFIETSFQLTVADAVASPNVSKVSEMLEVSEMSEVSEGSSVNLSCTAAVPCPSQPPTITWSLPTGNVHTQIRDEEDGTKSLLSCLTFTASRSHHGREISCMASYLRQNQSTVAANSTVQILRVLFSPEDVAASVSPSGPVPEGSSVTLTCNSSEANPPVQNYTWLRGEQHTPIGSGQTLTFNLSSSEEGLYYCRAEHPQGGKKSAAVTLTIKGLDQMESVLIIGAAGGSLAVLLLAVLIICVIRWNKSPITQEQNSECETSATCDENRPAGANRPEPSEEQPEEIHYGEIVFSSMKLRDTSEKTEQEQETEYAEVNQSGRDTQTSDQTGPDNEELYAQVRK
ncbi:sialoadhesin [Clupea harengus]|uniref:Sialoadhesin n=1 Tax=Clupea harengus TaxID=7950 RepID=A0A6P8GK84_CLUHA|nr:sialoadhesin [Clupea harengus]